MKRTTSILVIAAFAIGFFGAAALTLYLPERKIGKTILDEVESSKNKILKA